MLQRRLLLVCSLATIASAAITLDAIATQDSFFGKRPLSNVAALSDPTPHSTIGKPPSLAIQEGSPGLLPAPGLRVNPRQVFYVYSDKGAEVNHYAPAGWMGDFDDIALNDHSTDQPLQGSTCLKITYLGRGSQGADWAGIFWQTPRGNWGTWPGGFRLMGMKRLTFWARGERGGEQINVFQVGGITGNYPDSGKAQIGPVFLESQWIQYAIDLSTMDLSRIAGGFAWATGRTDNRGPITFYLDDIRFER